MDEKYPLALPQGTILAGQFVIEKTLGQGGFGITYRATDHKTGQPVAVKEFFPDAMVTRTHQTTVTVFSGERGESFAYGKTCFLQEAETLAKFIGNESIVRIHTYFEENDTAYFVMDYVEGTSFAEYIKNHGGKISYEDAERILLPVIDALATVHSKGIVHRDVTPDNIYITNDGKVKLLDFGAARYSLGDKSRSLDVVLKHGFAPKEQYTRRGKQGPFTDVYTVGATFYFAITGKRPPDSIDRMDEDELIPPSSRGVAIPREKEDAILQALSVQPQERFQTMEVFRRALMQTDAQPMPNMQQTSNSQPKLTRVDYTPQTQFDAMGAEPLMKNQESVQTENIIATADSGEREDDRKADENETGKETNPGMALPEKKKKWILPVGIGAAVAVVAVIVIVIVNISKEDQGASYDPSEQVAQESTQSNEEPVYSNGNQEILGNTADNIRNGGRMTVDDEAVYYAHPGDGLRSESYDGESAFYLDDSGTVDSISQIGDWIYYLSNGRAYQVKKDGSSLQEISILEDISWISQMYVTEDHFFVYIDEPENEDFDEKGIQSYSRRTGELEGGIICDKEDYVTFANGMIYYMVGRKEKEVWCVPMDNISATPTRVIDKSIVQNCFILSTDGRYLYGVIDDEDGRRFTIFQYDMKGENETYAYHLPNDNGWDGLIRNLNVVNQNVYFSFWFSDTDATSVHQFYAEPGVESFDVNKVYTLEKEENIRDFSVLQNKLLVVSSWGTQDALILVALDGSSEPWVVTE